MSKKYNQADFFALLAPTVVKIRQEGSKMLPSVRLAQNWLETGGKIHAWNNLGGYKVGSGKLNVYWDGASVNTGTWEVYDGKKVNTTANWRAYSSIYNFYKDQDLLFAKSRYDRVRAATTPAAQCNALYACGYATDPDYAAKLLSIIKAHNLTRYDIPAKTVEQIKEEEDMDKLESAQAQFKPFAQTIIDSYLGPAWNKHNDAYKAALAKGDKVEADKQLALRDWQNKLANAARAAAGIPKQ